jgi:predicted nuclease of predicted toxin-antitoxin system
VKFLIDNALSPAIAEYLRRAGHDAVHVRDYKLETAEDETIFERAAGDNCVLVSADTDFARLLAIRRQSQPSVILFRRASQRRPEAQAKLLLANLPSVSDLLERGAVVVFEENRLRCRLLPIEGE